jgi:hypothetical protein
LVETHTGKTSSLRLVACISDQFPTKETPTTSLRLARQVSASHDKSPSRMTGLRLARQVSASHEKSGPDWHMSPDAQHKRHHRRAWRYDSPRRAGTTAGSHAINPLQHGP